MYINRANVLDRTPSHDWLTRHMLFVYEKRTRSEQFHHLGLRKPRCLGGRTRCKILRVSPTSHRLNGTVQGLQHQGIPLSYIREGLGVFGRAIPAEVIMQRLGYIPVPKFMAIATSKICGTRKFLLLRSETSKSDPPSNSESLP